MRKIRSEAVVALGARSLRRLAGASGQDGAGQNAPLGWTHELGGHTVRDRALVSKAGPGIGVEEAASPWADELSPEKVDGYLDDVLAGARRFLAGPAIDLDAVPDAGGALIRAGIGPGEFGWLHRMWQEKPAAWLVRWPLLGHVGSHVGEMIATRNRRGLSPF